MTAKQKTVIVNWYQEGCFEAQITKAYSVKSRASSMDEVKKIVDKHKAKVFGAEEVKFLYRQTGLFKPKKRYGLYF